MGLQAWWTLCNKQSLSTCAHHVCRSTVAYSPLTPPFMHPGPLHQRAARGKAHDLCHRARVRVSAASKPSYV